MDALDMAMMIESLFGPPAILADDIGVKVTKPVTVFRVEMPNGNGPYNSGLPNSHDIYIKLCDPRHGFDCARLARENHEDINVTGTGFHDQHGHANYGCASTKSVAAWFPRGAREYLAGFGAKLVEYEVPEGDYVLETGAHGEMIFNRYTAKRVGERDLVTLK